MTLTLILLYTLDLHANADRRPNQEDLYSCFQQHTAYTAAMSVYAMFILTVSLNLQPLNVWGLVLTTDLPCMTLQASSHP